MFDDLLCNFRRLCLEKLTGPYILMSDEFSNGALSPLSCH